LSTELASRFAQVGSDTVYVSNVTFKPKFNADALDLSKGLFEPLLVRLRRWYPVIGSALLVHAHINAFWGNSDPPAAAARPTRDEARRIAANIAKLPGLVSHGCDPA
jgi:hypothetical protein